MPFVLTRLEKQHAICSYALAFAMLRDKDNFLIVASSDDASNYLSGASA
jgi:hypothetical protein